MKESFPRRTEYALIIPVLNEGDRIRRQIEQMRQYASQVDIFIVDGGSTDGSIDPGYFFDRGVRAVFVKKGPGKQSAQLRIGIAHALKEGYAGTLLMDGNNKDNPAAIPNFIKALDEGHDHVQGSRFIPGGRHENTPLIRYIAIRWVHAPLISLSTGQRFTDTTNGFKAYSRRFLLDPRVQPFRDIFITYELHCYMEVRAARLGLRLLEIPVERRYPKGQAVPTKIKGFHGPALMLRILLRACLGLYNPSNSAPEKD
jgi:glycosyltransferase involved in cell wall biosynthesis